MIYINEKILKISKTIAIFLIAVSTIILAIFAIYFYSLYKGHENNNAKRKITFQILRNAEIHSLSDVEVYINGKRRYEKLEADSSGAITLSIATDEGFRPVGNISSTIETISMNAYSLKISYKEGVNKIQKFMIKPEIRECDSMHLSTRDLRNQIDSLREKIVIIQRKMSNIEY
jgi:uncharacterized protein YpmB